MATRKQVSTADHNVKQAQAGAAQEPFDCEHAEADTHRARQARRRYRGTKAMRQIQIDDAQIRSLIVRVTSVKSARGGKRVHRCRNTGCDSDHCARRLFRAPHVEVSTTASVSRRARLLSAPLPARVPDRSMLNDGAVE